MPQLGPAHPALVMVTSSQTLVSHVLGILTTVFRLPSLPTTRQPLVHPTLLVTRTPTQRTLSIPQFRGMLPTRRLLRMPRACAQSGGTPTLVHGGLVTRTQAIAGPPGKS